MKTTSQKIITANAEHIINLFWMSRLVNFENYEDAKYCALIAIDELYDGEDKQLLINEILSMSWDK